MFVGKIIVKKSIKVLAFFPTNIEQVSKWNIVWILIRPDKD